MRVYYGWHWVGPDRRLGYGDGRLVEAGQTLEVEGPPVMCKRGLHASRTLSAAQTYAPHNAQYLCRVKLHGDLDLRGQDKACGTRRSCLWMVDVSPKMYQIWRDRFWRLPAEEREKTIVAHVRSLPRL